MVKITREIMSTIENRIGIKLPEGKDVCDLNLLGDDIGMSPRDLVYLYFMIKEKYEINLKMLRGGGFMTINSIRKTILHSQ